MPSIQCTACNNKTFLTKDSFQHIGKTYYILPDYSIICFRHWHQAGRPKYMFYGEYEPVKIKVLELEKLKTKTAKVLDMPAEPKVLEMPTRGTYRDKHII